MGMINDIKEAGSKYKDLLIPLGTLGVVAALDKLGGDEQPKEEEPQENKTIADVFGWREADKMPDAADEEYKEMMEEKE
jgi:hypothetical protein